MTALFFRESIRSCNHTYLQILIHWTYLYANHAGNLPECEGLLDTSCGVTKF